MTRRMSLWWYFLSGVVVGITLVSTLFAQTPFDQPTLALGTFIRTNLGPILVMTLLIVGFLGLGVAFHNGPAVLMGLVIVMIMVVGISSALNGTAISWLGLTAIP
jgi:hypothetical protein